MEILYKTVRLVENIRLLGVCVCHCTVVFVNYLQLETRSECPGNCIRMLFCGAAFSIIA